MIECDFCHRKAIMQIRKGYPSKVRFTHNVCGYHLRPYKTSEFKKKPLVVAPEKPVMGYAPKEMV